MDSRLLESTTVIHSDFYYEVQYTFARRRDIKGRQHNIEPDGRNLSGPFVVTTWVHDPTDGDICVLTRMENYPNIKYEPWEVKRLTDTLPIES